MMQDKTEFINFIKLIHSSLDENFGALDVWFDKEPGLFQYTPRAGWSVPEVLEHVGLTNHFLLILIRKGVDKALRNINKLDLDNELTQFQPDLEKLNEIGLRGSFNWERPEHMEPAGKDLVEVRKQLKEQRDECAGFLETMKNGEGLLYKTRMSVNDLGKINVYEYIYFLSLHARRHLAQLEKIEEEKRGGG